jgi:hypothetical protein
MNKIGLLNVDSVLESALSSTNPINVNEGFHDVKALFIDWIPTSDDHPKNTKKLIRQVDAVKHYLKKKTPLIIFDRYRKLTDTEIDFFKKNNTTLFEPSIRLRKGFEYLPYWVSIKNINELKIDDHDRQIDILYKGNLPKNKIESFRKYYVETAKNFSDTKICYNKEYEIEPDIDLYYKEIVHITEKDYHDSKYTILIGSSDDYRDGYIDCMFFDALNNGCIPLIPHENRYYGSFKTICISPTSLSWFFETTYNFMYLGIISDIYKEIEQFYPEMDVRNVVNIIKNICNLQ